MEEKDIKQRMEYLKAVLEENSRKYYVENAPAISDFEFDTLMHELEALEAQYPQYASADSPTRKVGSDLEQAGNPQAMDPGIRKEFAQYPHAHPMLSLANTYSIGEVEEFAARAAKTLDRGFTYSCELKFDGTAICLTYRNGRLFRALTRGDGVIGDDVTDNVRQISNIPQTLKGSGWPEEFEIRGEILMPYSSFDRLNAQRLRDEDQPFANPRNAASGSLKLLDPGEVGRRGLWCTLYHIAGDNAGFATHKEALDAASSWGLPVSDKRRICHDISEIKQYIDYWDTERRNLPYATDGIVIKINEISAREALGFTSKFPRWAVAYKFKAEQALTEVLSIDYQVGRTGAVTPVANLSPVPLSGTVVKRATLNNADQMALLDIRIGDMVYVEKGGEIIPKITAVEKSRRPAGAVPPVFPSVCPDCGTPLVREEDEAKWFCPNSDGCPQQIKGRLVHFMGRKAMNIIAGDATADQLFSKGLVKSPADLYSLDKYQLTSLEGWKDRSAERFLASLAESKNVPFPRVLFALGIRYVGETTAKEVAAHFRDIGAIASATVETLLEVPDVGEVIARSIHEFFRDPRHAREVERLRAAGLRMSMEEPSGPSSDALKDLSIVISGTFSISRDEMKALIEANGGKNSSGVSKKTSFLLAGEKPGPEKVRKAQDLGIKIISEADFMKMLPQSYTEEDGQFPGSLFDTVI
ncbi:MAG: NAD-dependent DNA ligase LigA [Candidatus Cryptobacteroides sp.]